MSLYGEKNLVKISLDGYIKIYKLKKSHSIYVYQNGRYIKAGETKNRIFYIHGIIKKYFPQKYNQLRTNDFKINLHKK